MLARNARVEEDLVDQLFNSSEKRLARVLLLMANFGNEGRPQPIITKVSQETLAEMIAGRNAIAEWAKLTYGWMGRSPEATRMTEADRTQWSFDGVEDVSGSARDAGYVFRDSLFRELYGIALPPAPEFMVARCDDVAGGFQ